MNSTWSDLLLVSPRISLFGRLDEVSRDYSMTLEVRAHLDELFADPVDARLAVVDCTSSPNSREMAESVQLVRQLAPAAFIVCVLGSRMRGEELAFVKKSGAGAFLLEEELNDTGKLDFIATQIVRSSNIAVKPDDFRVGTVLPVDLFHLLPQRAKFLPVAFEGDELSPAKMRRLQMVPELYIRRGAASPYADYMARTVDASAAGLLRRCRASFLALHSGFIDLVLFLGNQAEYSSFDEGTELMGRLRSLAGSLLVTLGSTGSAWKVINNSSVGDMGSVERTSAVAAYAGLIGLQLGLDRIEDLMVCAMIAELGMVFLPPGILRKIREQRTAELDPEELGRLRDYPRVGVQAVLSRKVQVEDSLRKVIFEVHARHDEGDSRAVRRSIESQVIRLAIELDRGSLVRLGQKRIEPGEVLRSVMREELEHPGRFSPEFSFGMRRALEAIEV